LKESAKLLRRDAQTILLAEFHSWDEVIEVTSFWEKQQHGILEVTIDGI
jgi:hypothetical protein